MRDLTEEEVEQYLVDCAGAVQMGMAESSVKAIREEFPNLWTLVDAAMFSACTAMGYDTSKTVDMMGFGSMALQVGLEALALTERVRRE